MEKIADTFRRSEVSHPTRSDEGICRVFSEYRDGNIQIIEGDIKNPKTLNVEMAIDSAELSMLIQDVSTIKYL